MLKRLLADLSYAQCQMRRYWLAWTHARSRQRIEGLQVSEDADDYGVLFLKHQADVLQLSGDVDKMNKIIKKIQGVLLDLIDQQEALGTNDAQDEDAPFMAPFIPGVQFFLEELRGEMSELPPDVDDEPGIAFALSVLDDDKRAFMKDIRLKFCPL